jgi:hypothetical protein
MEGGEDDAAVALLADCDINEADVMAWDVMAVADFFNGLGLSANYTKTLKANGVDGPALVSLAEHAHNGQALKIQIKYLEIKIGDALKISKALKRLEASASLCDTDITAQKLTTAKKPPQTQIQKVTNNNGWTRAKIQPRKSSNRTRKSRLSLDFGSAVYSNAEDEDAPSVEMRRVDRSSTRTKSTVNNPLSGSEQFYDNPAAEHAEQRLSEHNLSVRPEPVDEEHDCVWACFQFVEFVWRIRFQLSLIGFVLLFAVLYAVGIRMYLAERSAGYLIMATFFGNGANPISMMMVFFFAYPDALSPGTKRNCMIFGFFIGEQLPLLILFGGGTAPLWKLTKEQEDICFGLLFIGWWLFGFSGFFVWYLHREVWWKPPQHKPLQFKLVLVIAVFVQIYNSCVNMLYRFTRRDTEEFQGARGSAGYLNSIYLNMPVMVAFWSIFFIVVFKDTMYEWKTGLPIR